MIGLNPLLAYLKRPYFRKSDCTKTAAVYPSHVVKKNNSDGSQSHSEAELAMLRHKPRIVLNVKKGSHEIMKTPAIREVIRKGNKDERNVEASTVALRGG